MQKRRALGGAGAGLQILHVVQNGSESVRNSTCPLAGANACPARGPGVGAHGLHRLAGLGLRPLRPLRVRLRAAFGGDLRDFVRVERMLGGRAEHSASYVVSRQI